MQARRIRRRADWALTKAEIDYLGQVGVELTGEYARNLERLMEVLHSLRFVLDRSPSRDTKPAGRCSRR